MTEPPILEDAPNFRRARRPTRIYSGVRTAAGCIVHVRDTARAEGQGNPCVLDPGKSRGIADYSDAFAWGAVDAAARQLAVALLLDVTGEPSIALKWCELFTSRYVDNLPADWTVPEIDIELWLYCFENSRQGA